MFKKEKKEKSVVFNQPVVNLIPIETIDNQNALKIKKNIVKTLISLIVLVALGAVLITGLNIQNNNTLTSVNNKITESISVQEQYSETTLQERNITLINGIRVEATANEINWGDFITRLNDSVVDNSSLLSLMPLKKDPVSTTEGTDTENTATGNSSEPSEENIVIEFDAIIKTADLPSLDVWSKKLTADMSEYGFSSVSFISTSESDSFYTTTLRLRFNEKILWDRFNVSENEQPNDSENTQDGE